MKLSVIRFHRKKEKILLKKINLYLEYILKQPYFKDVEYRVVGDLTHTEKTMNDTFWVGVQPALDEVHFDFVAEKLEELFGLNF